MPDLALTAKRAAKRTARRLDLPPRDRWPQMPGYADALELRWRLRFSRIKPITPEQFTAKVPVGEIEEIVACSLCGERTFQPAFHPKDRSGRGRWQYRVVRCPSCGFFYRQPGIKPERLGDLYAKKYSKFLKGKYSAKRIRRYELVMDAFDPFFADGAGRRLLDFGCGNGLFLEQAYKRGFDPYGVDLSPDSIEVAREHPSGRNAYFGSPTEVPEIAAGGFDVITLWSVLAHLTSPVEDFEMLRSLLAPGGALLILTVNANGLYFMQRGDDWQGFTPNHLKFFSPTTLPRLLERTGFEAVVFRPMYGDPIEAGTSRLSERNVKRIKRAIDRGNRGNMMRVIAFRDADSAARWGFDDAIRL